MGNGYGSGPILHMHIYIYMHAMQTLLKCHVLNLVQTGQ